MKKSRKKNCAVNVGRWMSYAAAGAVTAAGAANDAEASILFSGLLNTPTPQAYGIENLSIKTLIANSVIGAENIARFTHTAALTSMGGLNPLSGNKSYKLHFRGSSANGDRAHGQPRGTTHAGIHYISKLASGARISSGNFIPVKGGNPMGTWNGHSTDLGNRKWSAAGTAFVGFEFNTGAGVQYGWAKVIDDGPKPYYMTLVDYALGTPGQAITAGETGLAVPEPASLGLLALGAAGLLATRIGRRRKTLQAIA